MSTPDTIDIGEVKDGQVSFPPWAAATEKPKGAPKNPDPPDGRIGFAVLSLGRLSLEQILPALAQCKHARLAALVSGTPAKLAAVGDQYGIPPKHRYLYEELERLADNPDVQVVYVIAPNALHEEYVRRAAAVGKHVLCEKPMSVNSASARRMIEACAQADRLLMVAYRSRFQPALREVIKIVRSGDLGKLKLINALNLQNQGAPAQWRQRMGLAGGGSLPDVGLYCLNVARAVAGEDPDQVSALITTSAADPRFESVEDQVAFTLRFPGGAVASCVTGYDAHKLSRMTVSLQDGWMELENAFDYVGARLRVARRIDEREHIAEVIVPEENQFMLEMDHFAECIRAGRQPDTPGELGWEDQRLMELIYQADREARTVPTS